MDRAYIGENDQSRERIKALIAELSDEEMALPINERWTVGTALMHLAFWDRMWLAKFEEWERTGAVVLPQLGEAVNGINDNMVAWWRAVAPVQVRHECIAAAEAMDHKLANLPDWLAEAILQVRPRALIRSIHRAEHLDKVDQALAAQRER